MELIKVGQIYERRSKEHFEKQKKERERELFTW